MRRKWLILVIVDLSIIWVGVLSSYLYRLGTEIPAEFVQQGIFYGIAATIASLFVMRTLKLYQRMWQYASIDEGIQILKAVIVINACAYVVTEAYSSFILGIHVPTTIALHIFQTTLMLMGAIRISWRLFRNMRRNHMSTSRRALILGAGDCGSMIAKEMKYDLNSGIVPVGFIDDDPHKHQQQIHGIPVVGGRSLILEYVKQQQITDIVIAMPSTSKREISKLIDICKQTKAQLKIIPHIRDLVNGKVTVQEIRNVEVEDLLARDPVQVDLEGIAGYLREKTVLVTGAGGSIGSELCRQIATFPVRQMLLLGQGENSIYTIEQELRQRFPERTFIPIIADVKDRTRIDSLFRKYQPEVIFHAAAHKHVPLMELNPLEAIKNNIFGTRHVAECAQRYGAERFVLISTDKAVNPTSVMGATKRLAEMVIQTTHETGPTIFSAVRFGNVLGSRGSVIPRFKQQIAAGGPVTVTHPEMVRYFMTIPEAVQLVIQAGGLAQGGEVFILDMGEPVKIVDLARDLIRLSGFEPGVDIEIQFTGIRPGEKLFEELLTQEEGVTSTRHERIFIGKPEGVNSKELSMELKKLERLAANEQADAVRTLLQHLVPHYQQPKQDRPELLSV